MNQNKIKLMKMLIKQYRSANVGSLVKLTCIKASQLLTTEIDGVAYYDIPSKLSIGVDIYIMGDNKIIMPWKYIRSKVMKDGDYSVYAPANIKQWTRIFPNSKVMYARQSRD